MQQGSPIHPPLTVGSFDPDIAVSELIRYFAVMNNEPASERERRLELARKAFKEFYARCFWSYREDLEITEEFIPFVVRAFGNTAAWPATALPASFSKPLSSM
jgi:hypothetical protein